MAYKNIAIEAGYTVLAAISSNSLRFLLYGVAAFAVAGAPIAHAIMGESAENRGLVIADAKGEVLLACVLGEACQTNDAFFRRMAVGQINRGGTIESNISFTGIGFGSLLSTEGGSGLSDILCWTGADQKDCFAIFEGTGPTSISGTIIDANSDSGSECAAAEELFGEPAGTFDYLVRFDEFRYGFDNAVEIVTCNGVDAQLRDSADIAQSEVIVRAVRGMAAYDIKLYGGLYCCR